MCLLRTFGVKVGGHHRWTADLQPQDLEDIHGCEVTSRESMEKGAVKLFVGY